MRNILISCIPVRIFSVEGRQYLVDVDEHRNPVAHIAYFGYCCAIWKSIDFQLNEEWCKCSKFVLDYGFYFCELVKKKNKETIFEKLMGGVHVFFVRKEEFGPLLKVDFEYSEFLTSFLNFP